MFNVYIIVLISHSFKLYSLLSIIDVIVLIDDVFY